MDLYWGQQPAPTIKSFGLSFRRSFPIPVALRYCCKILKNFLIGKTSPKGCMNDKKY